MVNVKILSLLLLVGQGLQAQKLFVANATKNRLNIYVSSWIKPEGQASALVHTKKVKLFPNKTEELGDTKKTLINEVRVAKTKNILSSKPTIDMTSLNKALKKARNYRNGAITLLFSIEPQGTKIYVNAYSEKEMRDLPTELVQSK